MFSFLTKKQRVVRNNTRKQFKKMKCSPITEGKTVNDNTCYTKKVIIDIRDEYNKSNLNKNKIKTDDPNTIWEELRANLVDCSTESCWLRELKNKKLSKKIQKYLFAPTQPPEWKQNPNEWLSNIDLLEVMAQYEIKYKNFKFIGPSCIDFDTKIIENDNKCVEQELCTFNLSEYIKKHKNKIGVIFNLDKHNQSGSHWVSLFIFMFFYIFR